MEFDKKNVLVEFYASWCGPCRMLEPILEELKEDFNVVRIDVDKNMDLAKEYGVMSVPTLIYFKDEKTYDRKIGFMTKEEIFEWVNSL